MEVWRLPLVPPDWVPSYSIDLQGHLSGLDKSNCGSTPQRAKSLEYAWQNLVIFIVFGVSSAQVNLGRFSLAWHPLHATPRDTI